MSRFHYTVEPGRVIARDGTAILEIRRSAEPHSLYTLSPSEADALTQVIAARLNEDDGTGTPNKIDRAIVAINEGPPSLEIVTRALNHWYHSEIRDLADAVVDECKARGIELESDEMSDVAHEIVDGTGIVIYTYQARLACVATDQPDRPCEDVGCEHLDPSVCAYYVVRADVEDELRRRG